MLKSNVITCSNIYYSSEDKPIFVHGYVEQILDYDLLKYIEHERYHDYKVISLSKKQEEIIRQETRCTYAKKDPCWGFSDKQNRVICACVNGCCPHIEECNSKYTVEDELFWKQREEDTLAYGLPSNLKKYYIVDLISDDEMQSYKTTPNNHGRIFSAMEPKRGNHRRVRIDPQTGRKMILVGYNWTLDVGYEDEICEEIWAFENETDEHKSAPIIKADIITELKEMDIPGTCKKDNIELRSELTETIIEYHSKVINRIEGLYDIFEAASKCLFEDELLIVVNNPAEKGYISNMLSKCEVPHGYDYIDKIQIAIYDEITDDIVRDRVLVVDSVIDNVVLDENNIWKILQRASTFYELNSPKKAYGTFEFRDENIWCIRGVYGITHICINENDIDHIYCKRNGTYNIELRLDNENYIIVCNGEIIGNTTSKFKKMLEEMCRRDEIIELPNMIKGIKLSAKEDHANIIGLGHLKFVGY